MKKYKWILILLNLLLLLVYFNWSIKENETLLTDGELVLLELAPVDPRSLMQGDYMSLRYAISQEASKLELPKRGYVVLQLDSNKLAVLSRFQEHKTPVSDGELLLKYYNKDSWNIFLGAESYFFQEGEAKKYEAAKYGGLKVDADGNSLLIGLYDVDMQLIE